MSLNNRSEERGGNAPLKAPRRARITALGAVALIAVLVSSDFYARQLWLGHPLTTAILASLSAVLVSVTVLEVVLKRRSERRWRLLAQYALLELAEAAHGAWGVLLGVIYEEASDSNDMADPSQVIQVLDSPARAPELKRKIDVILTDPLGSVLFRSCSERR
jgi:hypothetical protein